MRSIIVLLTFFSTSYSFGIGLVSPYSVGTTTTLPKGVRNVMISGITAQYGNRFNDLGVSDAMAGPFNQTLTYGRLLHGEKNQKLVDDVEAALLAKGISLDTPAGDSKASIISRATVTSPVIAYGITDKWSVAVTVPIVYTNISVATGFIARPQLVGVLNDFNNKSANKTKDVEAKLNDVISTEINSKGYEPLVNQESTEVGDLSIFSRVNVHQGRNLSITLGQFITAPTGRQFSVNKVIDPAPGDGQWDFGTSATFNYKLAGDKMILFSETQARWQFAHRRAMRIPIDTVERLSSDIDYNTYRKLGDIYQTSLGSIFQITNWIGAAMGYQVGYKEKDIYRGDAIADFKRYDALSFETEQFMQAGIWQFNVSSLQAFKANKFPLPFTWSVNFSRTFQGRNIRTDDMWSTNLAVFF